MCSYTGYSHIRIKKQQVHACERVGSTMLNVRADFISACEVLLFEDDYAVSLRAYKRLKHA